MQPEAKKINFTPKNDPKKSESYTMDAAITSDTFLKILGKRQANPHKRAPGRQNRIRRIKDRITKNRNQASSRSGSSRRGYRRPNQGARATSSNPKTNVNGVQRLVREVKHLEKETVPIVGLWARPYRGDIRRWRVLLTGPKDSIYEGLYVRVEIVLSTDYPREPPSRIVTVGDKVPHPYIFGNNICLECFQKNVEQSKGWNSLYTLNSIFQQLHGFLWEGHFAFKDHKKNKKLIRELIKKNEVFKYGDKEQGWPGSSAADDFKEAEFLTKKSSLEVYRDNLLCFHSKIPAEENPLGYGVNITRVARTGEVKKAKSVDELISLRAFMKYGVRRSPSGDTFGYWIPAYLGVEKKDRTLHLAKRALSFIMTNQTSQFDPVMAPKVLLKTLVTSLLGLFSSKETVTIKRIRQLVHYHSLLLLFTAEYPEVVEYLDEGVEKFIAKPENRTKKETPNLGKLLLSSLFSDKYKFEDIVTPYFEEQLDRQVFWILRKIPELEDDTNTFALDKNRVEVSFATLIVGYRLMMFYHDYYKTLKEEFADRAALLTYLEQNSCKLPNNLENKILEKFKDIAENVKDYNGYFKRVGLPEKTQDELTNMLKQAVKNSKTKKYHGEVDEVIGLPEELDQGEGVFGQDQDPAGLHRRRGWERGEGVHGGGVEGAVFREVGVDEILLQRRVPGCDDARGARSAAGGAG